MGRRVHINREIHALPDAKHKILVFGRLSAVNCYRDNFTVVRLLRRPDFIAFNLIIEVKHFLGNRILGNRIRGQIVNNRRACAVSGIIAGLLLYFADVNLVEFTVPFRFFTADLSFDDIVNDEIRGFGRCTSLIGNVIGIICVKTNHLMTRHNGSLGMYVGIRTVLIYVRRIQCCCAEAVGGLFIIYRSKERSCRRIVKSRLLSRIRQTLIRGGISERNIVLWRCSVDVQIVDGGFALVINDKAGRDHIIRTTDVDNHHCLTRTFPVIFKSYRIIIRRNDSGKYRCAIAVAIRVRRRFLAVHSCAAALGRLFFGSSADNDLGLVNNEAVRKKIMESARCDSLVAANLVIAEGPARNRYRELNRGGNFVRLEIFTLIII